MPEFAEASKCTGCFACVNICPKQCIQMKANEEGFLFPLIFDMRECVDCGLCEKVCPVLNNKKDKVSHLTEVYAAYTLKSDIRRESSSGGIFSELAVEVIKKSGVVYGAAYDNEFVVHHICVESEVDINKLRGAKYSQSDLGRCFTDVKKRLDKGRLVLFSGTPCQVAGLKSFLGKEYSNLLCVDFVCHGVPSPMVWKEYVRYRSSVDAEGIMPDKINLRSKESGWSNYRYSNVYEYPNGKKYFSLSGDDLYMKLYTNNYISRKSCSECGFKGHKRTSDFTIGDFWGIWEIDPVMDDNQGTSLVLIHSQKGKNLFETIQDRIKYKQMTLEQAIFQNKSLIESSEEQIRRKEIIEMVRMGKISEVNNIFPKAKCQKKLLISKIKENVVRYVHHVYSDS